MLVFRKRKDVALNGGWKTLCQLLSQKAYVTIVRPTRAIYLKRRSCLFGRRERTVSHDSQLTSLIQQPFLSHRSFSSSYNTLPSESTLHALLKALRFKWKTYLPFESRWKANYSPTSIFSHSLLSTPINATMSVIYAYLGHFTESSSNTFGSMSMSEDWHRSKGRPSSSSKTTRNPFENCPCWVDFTWILPTQESRLHNTKGDCTRLLERAGSTLAGLAYIQNRISHDRE
jgi:hypothetical protein